MCTGIRDDSIRTELKTLLEKYESDEKLIEEVNKLVSLQEEINTKFKVKKVNKLSTEESSEGFETQIIKELKALRAEVNELRNSKDKPNDAKSNGKPDSRKKSCPNCVGKPGRCVHCWKCGSPDHRQFHCPENSQGSLKKQEGEQ